MLCTQRADDLTAEMKHVAIEETLARPASLPLNCRQGRSASVSWKGTSQVRRGQVIGQLTSMEFVRAILLERPRAFEEAYPRVKPGSRGISEARGGRWKVYARDGVGRT